MEVETKPQATALAPVNDALTEFEKVSASLIDLTKRHANVVYPVATTKGMDDAKAARKEIRDVRYAIQRAEKSASDELNSIKKNVKERADQIITVLRPLEDAVDVQITAEEERRAEEKRKKEEAEAARIAAIRDRIATISKAPTEVAGMPSATIKRSLDLVLDIPVDESFAEFKEEASAAKDGAVSVLTAMHERAVAAEEAAAALRVQQEELARQRAELERQRQEIEAARAAMEAAKAQAAAAERAAQEQAERSAQEQAKKEAFRSQEQARLLAEPEAKAIEAAQQEDAFAPELQQASETAAQQKSQTRIDMRNIAGEYKALGIVAPKPVVAAQPAPVVEPVPVVETIEIKAPGAPTGVDIVMAVGDYFGVSMETAWQWISEINAGEIEQAIAEAA